VAERGDVFVVWSATLFGLLGLRSAYTLVTRALPLMPYLQKATGAVLVFVGVRALADYFGVQVRHAHGSPVGEPVQPQGRKSSL